MQNTPSTAIQLEGMSGAFVNQFIGMPCPINAEDIDFVAGALGRSVDTICSFCPEESLAVEGGEMRFAAHFDQDGTILHIDSYGTDERTQAFLDSLIGLDPDALEMRGDDGISQNDEILEILLGFLYESVL